MNKKDGMPNACITGNKTHQQSKSCLTSNHSSRPYAPFGRAREGSHPLAPRHPRGCRGAERPTPASSKTKTLKRIPPPCITGNRSSRQISPRRAREGRSPFELPIKRISAGNRILFRGGAAAGELAPPPLRLIQTSPVPFQTSSVRRSSPPSRACAPPASSSCRIPSPPTRPEPRPRSFP